MLTSLLLALLFCHFLADFTHLSNAWMLNAKRLGTPALPILAHASVHATLMAATLFIFGVKPECVFALTIAQLSSHFAIDVCKGRMNQVFPSLLNPAVKWHWVVFGFDQFLHTAVIILMVEYAKDYI